MCVAVPVDAVKHVLNMTTNEHLYRVKSQLNHLLDPAGLLLDVALQ